MNRRKTAIAIIVADVAETGIAGRSALRAYVETRMSRQTFDQACRTGAALYRRRALGDTAISVARPDGR